MMSEVIEDRASKEYFLSRFFCNWYRENGRSFPWREEGVGAYGILVAEFMLRKTQAEKVCKYWQDFTANFPTPYDCVELDEETLIERIRPLGLATIKAKAWKEICRIIVESHNGKIPESIDMLERLPHIGTYTARAIYCFAFNKRVPLVDGNVIRVLSRILGDNSKRDNRRVPAIWTLAERILPVENFKEHNYGILDFSAQICTSRSPKCSDCDIKIACATRIAAQLTNDV